MGDPTGREIIRRRHREWSEHVNRWRWLLDSWEGGEAYRQAIYGTDARGMPVRNLIRHKREYPLPPEAAESRDTVVMAGSANGIAGLISGLHGPGFAGADPAATATDDDYELRRARTPVPTFLAEVVGIHLGKIYGREVTRTFPGPLEPLREWTRDVDGLGTTIDDWMAETVAPLLLVLGQVDVCVDHPSSPAGEDVVSEADARRLGLDRAVASHILPMNVLWWRLDPRTLRYEEVLVCEVRDPDGRTPAPQYRHWTPTDWTLYDEHGEIISGMEHPYGRPPIVRLFDRRKPRCRNVGHPRHEGVAERQREYYNRDSELILSDTMQAHPILQGPEDFVTGDGQLNVGPNWLLPKKRNNQGGNSTYEGFDVVDFGKGGAESIRLNKRDIRDDVDRDAGLTKPAGASGSTGTTVAQSGISKQLDRQDGNTKLTDQAKILARAESSILALAWIVLRDDAEADASGAVVEYPMVFDLTSPAEFIADWTAFQAMIADAADIPATQVAVFVEALRKVLPGRKDEFYEAAQGEFEAYLADAASRAEQAVEAFLAAPAPAVDPINRDPGQGGPGEAAGTPGTAKGGSDR